MKTEEDTLDGPVAGKCRDRQSMRWPIVILAVLLVLDVWYRAHTFAPTITQATGLSLADGHGALPNRSIATRRLMRISAIGSSRAM